MAEPDPDRSDLWRRYWANLHDGSRRLQIEHAAGAPLSRWLVADAATLVEDEEYGLDPAHLERQPDTVLAAARDGFAAFVEEGDLDPVPDDRYGYEVVPIHLTTVRRLGRIEPDTVDPVEDGNRLVLLSNATVVEEPQRSVRAAVVTYRCPRGHETPIRQPLLRHCRIETCGESDCEMPVVPDDSRTKAQRVCRFTVETDTARPPCVATGQYAGATEAFERLDGTRTLELTGILRPVTDDEGAIDPVLEVLHAETY